jgi:hypothetical protein
MQELRCHSIARNVLRLGEGRINKRLVLMAFVKPLLCVVSYYFQNSLHFFIF